MKQVTKDKDIVRICSVKELKFNFVKSTYARILREEKEDRELFNKIVMDLIPKFHLRALAKEIALGKDRNDFNIIETTQLMNSFEKEHEEKVKILYGVRI